MARNSNAPKPGEAQEFFLNLYEDVALDLHVYCEILDAQKTKVINRAVRALIEADLDQNLGFKSRCDELKNRLIQEARRARQVIRSGHLRVLDVRQGNPRRAQRRRTKSPANSEYR